MIFILSSYRTNVSANTLDDLSVRVDALDYVIRMLNYGGPASREYMDFVRVFTCSHHRAKSPRRVSNNVLSGCVGNGESFIGSQDFMKFRCFAVFVSGHFDPLLSYTLIE